MSPNPTLLPFPCGSAPFDTRRGGHLCGSRCQRTLSAHRRVSTPYPLSSVVSGAVLPPGHKSWSRCPLSALLRQPEALRLLWRIVLRRRQRKTKLNQCCCGVAGPPGRGALGQPDCETTSDGRETIGSCK
jgi:hypothetical protein